MRAFIVCALAVLIVQKLLVVSALEAVDGQFVSETFPIVAKEVNGNPNSTWQAAPNHFSTWTWADVKRMLLKNYPRRERIPEAVLATMERPSTSSIPDSFDARTAWPECAKPIRDQGHCKSRAQHDFSLFSTSCTHEHKQTHTQTNTQTHKHTQTHYRWLMLGCKCCRGTYRLVLCWNQGCLQQDSCTTGFGLLQLVQHGLQWRNASHKYGFFVCFCVVFCLCFVCF